LKPTCLGELLESFAKADVGVDLAEVLKEVASSISKDGLEDDTVDSLDSLVVGRLTGEPGDLPNKGEDGTGISEGIASGG
jgi:hypothetical protein